MNFINLTESIDASRKLDEFENSNLKDKHKNIFIEEIFEDLFNNEKISDNKIYNHAKNLNIGIVLTAHPTEVKRRTLIQKYHKITELLENKGINVARRTIAKYRESLSIPPSNERKRLIG